MAKEILFLIVVFLAYDNKRHITYCKITAGGVYESQRT